MAETKDWLKHTEENIAGFWKRLGEHQEIKDIKVVWELGQWWVVGSKDGNRKVFSVHPAITENGSDWFWFKEVRMKNVGPFMNVSRDMMLHFEQRGDFRVIIYGAYNAEGLIAPEDNGIGILDENKYQVLLASHCRQTVALPAPCHGQYEELVHILAMDWEAFRTFVNNHPHARYQI